MGNPAEKPSRLRSWLDRLSAKDPYEERLGALRQKLHEHLDHINLPDEVLGLFVELRISTDILFIKSWWVAKQSYFDNFSPMDLWLTGGGYIVLDYIRAMAKNS